MGDAGNPLIVDAIKACGTQQKLAERMGVKQQTVSKLLWFQLRIDADYAIAIDRATGGAVPRWRLRPDLFEPPADAMPSDAVSVCLHCGATFTELTAPCSDANCPLPARAAA